MPYITDTDSIFLVLQGKGVHETDSSCLSDDYHSRALLRFALVVLFGARVIVVVSVLFVTAKDPCDGSPLTTCCSSGRVDLACV